MTRVGEYESDPPENLAAEPEPAIGKVLSDKLALLKERKKRLAYIGIFGQHGSKSDFLMLGITEKEYQTAVHEAHNFLANEARERLKDLKLSIQEDIEKL